LGDVLWAAGRVREALPYYDQSVKDGQKVASGGSNLVVTGFYTLVYVVMRHAQLGDFAAAGSVADSGKPYLAMLRKNEPGSTATTVVDMMGRLAVAIMAQQRSDDAAARRIAGDITRELQPIKVKNGIEAFQKNTLLFWASAVEGQAAYAQNDYAGAERAMRVALSARAEMGSSAQDDKRQLGTLSTWLAMALARQGKSAEAAKVIAPVVQLERALVARNRNENWVPVELAGALYAQAMGDRAKSVELLREAAALLDALPSDLRNMHDVRLTRHYISADRSAGG
jgi:tetratricopeptide (TPR) repeat protein